MNKTDLKRESMNESIEVEIRNAELKATIDKRTKMQSWQVLNFSSEENQAEFLDFLSDHMAFT